MRSEERCVLMRSEERCGLICIYFFSISCSFYILIPHILLRRPVYRTSGVIFFYRLLHSYTRHIEGVKGGERDILLVHKNEAMVAWPEAIACHNPRRQSGVIKAHPPPSHSTFPWTEISDLQEKRLKSMTASF